LSHRVIDSTTQWLLGHGESVYLDGQAQGCRLSRLEVRRAVEGGAGQDENRLISSAVAGEHDPTRTRAFSVLYLQNDIVGVRDE
jgi:hypothetical protein